MARATGFEPAISSVTGKRFEPLSYARIFSILLCRREESNFRPQPYEDFALTTELRRHGSYNNLQCIRFLLVAGAGIAPASQGYGPRMVLLHYPAYHPLYGFHLTIS